MMSSGLPDRCSTFSVVLAKAGTHNLRVSKGMGAYRLMSGTAYVGWTAPNGIDVPE